MAPEPKHTRKRDKIKHLFSFGRNPTPQSADSSADITESRALNPTLHNTQSRQPQPSDTAPKGVGAHVVLPPASAPIKAQKAFAKGKSFERDIALLYASFVLQETPELKELIQLIAVVHDNDKEDELSNVLEVCARFTVQLASPADADRTEAMQAITAFKGTIHKIRKAQLENDAAALDGLSNMVNHTISQIKPSFLHDGKDGRSERLCKVLDVTIGTAISVLGVVHSASSLIPVPWVQPVVGQVVSMLQAVSQTRSNYNDMKEVAAIAGEFVISCAVICSESTEGPSSEFKRALNKFTKKLEGIAEDCNKLSRLDLFSRYFQQSGHARDLQAIRTRLNDAIDLFQNETLINIKLDTEALKRNFDFASLNSLPSHPQYTRNEYLEKSRDDVIGYVSNWIANAQEFVLWIHGAAGLGKSTVAQQLIYLLQCDDRLAGGVLLTHISKDHPVEVIRMIAKQIGEKHPQAIADVAGAARKLTSAHDHLSDYLATYITNPVCALKYPYQLVIVIDGLDEWIDHGLFLEELARIPLPSPVKFILTSRFNYSIERVLDKIPIHKYALPPVSQSVVERYFHHHFESNDIIWRGRKPDQQKISRLAALTDGLLIWAATVRSLVLNKFDPRDPHIILEEILSSEKVAAKSAHQLESLYHGALSTLFPPDIQGTLRDFLGATMILEEPLLVPDFAHLLGISERTTEEIHRGLAALRIRGDAEGQIILPAIQSFHASFIEFIQSIPAESCGESFQAISPADVHFMLANRCLEIVFAKFLPSFRGRTCTYSELHGVERYAVKYWPLHLSNGTDRTLVSASSALANLSSTALCRWVTLFLPYVSSKFQDKDHNLDNVPKTQLPYELARIIGDEDATTLMYHVHCLEVGIRLEPSDTETWVALGKAYDKMYNYGRSVGYLEEEITAFRHALKLTGKRQESSDALVAEVDITINDRRAADTRTTYTDILAGPANALQTRFDQQGAPEDHHKAISLNQEALDLRPAPHPDRSMLLNNLGSALRARFNQQGALNDLDEAISLHREALDLRPAPHPDRSMSLNNLANALRARFNQQGALNDLDEAISLHREALDLRPAPHPDRSMSLNNLANALRARFNQQGALNDLDEAISLHREALDLRPAPHPVRSMSLNNLATALQARFSQQGAPNDLDEVISLNREALDLRPAPHPDRSMSLNNLANALRARFNQQGALNDLDEAISLHREALDLRPAPHPVRSMSLNNLATALQARFSQQGAPNDLDEAISLHREALDLRPAPHPDRSMSLNNLANALRARFNQQGALNDLDEAISLHREALDLRPAPHPVRSISLNNLANALWARFNQQGALNDLDEAISLHREALDLCPTLHPLRSLPLNNLAEALLARFNQQSAPNNLDEAISLNREALDLRPAPHPLRSSSLNNLAEVLLARFNQSGAPNDLDEAISLNREALNLCPAPHPVRSMSLNNLATALQARFSQQGAPNDLDEAISLNREALDLRPAPHPDRWMSLHNLARVLRIRFIQKHAPADLADAISLHHEAIALRSLSQPQYSALIKELLLSLDVQFKENPDPKFLNESITLYRQLLDLPLVPVKYRSWASEQLPIALRARHNLNGDSQDLKEAAVIEATTLDKD